MQMKARLTRLERLSHASITEAGCICFPPDEPPALILEAERKAARAVLCPIHGERFHEFEPSHLHPGPCPTHLQPESFHSWRSEQYRKAFEASFPPDRWPAARLVDNNGTLRFVLKDGTEIQRIEPPEIRDYKTNLPATKFVDPDGTVRLMLRGEEIHRIEAPEVLDYNTGLPATRSVDADGTVRYALNDGTALTAYTLTPNHGYRFAVEPLT